MSDGELDIDIVETGPNGVVGACFIDESELEQFDDHHFRIKYLERLVEMANEYDLDHVRVCMHEGLPMFVSEDDSDVRLAVAPYEPDD